MRANVRTANAAKESGLRKALTIAFRAGGVAGMFTVGLGLFGATLILMIFKGDATAVLVGFAAFAYLPATMAELSGNVLTAGSDINPRIFAISAGAIDATNSTGTISVP